jgi:molybdopterin molybdotransferase
MEKLFRIRDGVIAAVAPLEAEDVALLDAVGRYLAAPALARVPAPPATCSAMDGYALRAEDVQGACALEVKGARYAGDLEGARLAPGTAVRIFTGAPLPPGADTVVREEATRAEGGRVRVIEAARRGDNVRRAGEDVVAGGLALDAGVRLGPRQAALLAAVGANPVRVHRRPASRCSPPVTRS